MDNQQIKVINEQPFKKQNKRILSAWIGLCVVVVDIVSLLAYLSIKKPFKPSEYKVGEFTITLYNNLLSFFNECSDGVHPVPNKLISVTFKDGCLNMSGINETKEIVIKYQTNKDDINSALVLFNKSIPDRSGVEIESAYTLSSEELNIDKNEYVGCISTSLTNEKYISYTYRADDKNLCSYPHQLYNESGLYSDGVVANYKDNKVLYDLYHYIIYAK